MADDTLRMQAQLVDKASPRGTIQLGSERRQRVSEEAAGARST
jgi:hypothetical protein